MNKKLGLAGLSLLLMLAVSGCGDKPTAAGTNGIQDPAVVSGAEGNDGNTSGQDNAAEATAEPTAGNEGSTNAPAPTEQVEPAQSEEVTVYYTDAQMLELKPAKVTISFSKADGKYTEAFKGLQTSGNPELIPLWGKIELKSLKYEDGQIIMDIHKPDEAQLGAGLESYAISALAQTMFQFSEVQSIEVLVDGEQVESLMGHVDLQHPMTRENSLISAQE